MKTSKLQLLVVGFSARWLQESAFLGGLRSHAVDFFADADTCQYGPVSRVARWRDVPQVAASLNPEAILIGSGFETQPATVRRLGALAPLLNTGRESRMASRDPGRWAPVLRAAGLQLPKMQAGSSRDLSAPTLPLGQQSRESLDWLVKHRYSAGGNGVREWPPMTAAGDRRGSLARGEYLQQRIAGEPHSLLFWLQPDQRSCLGFFRQLCGDAALGAKPFQFAGAIGPLPVDDRQSARFQRVAEALFADLGLRGLIGVDLICVGESCFAIEINPRPTATAELWERAFPGQSLIGKLWEAHAGGRDARLASNAVSAAIHGKAILYWSGPRSLLIDAGQAERFRQAWLDGWLKDLPAEGTTIEPGQPVATVFAVGPDAEGVRAELQTRVDALRRELERGDRSPGTPP